jgi:hypothetical protein
VLRVEDHSANFDWSVGCVDLLAASVTNFSHD